MSTEYEAQIRAIIENTPNVAIQGFDHDARITFWNSASLNVYGYRAEEALGNRLLDLGFWSAQEESEFQKLIAGIITSGKSAPMKEWLIRASDGNEKVILSTLFPIHFGKDQTSVICMDVDITQRKEAEKALRVSEERARDLADRLKILLRELDHRVKNNLSSLHALVDLYSKSSPDVLAFARAMHGKLDAMSSAHELTSSGDGKRVTVDDLVGHLTQIHEAPGGEGGGLETKGEKLRVPARQAAPLAMVLEELFSNATKHGAWRRAGGKIVLRWELIDHAGEGRRVKITWNEPSEKPLAAPASRGVGLGLIEAFTRFELRGHARYFFDARGYTCELECTFDDEG